MLPFVKLRSGGRTRRFEVLPTGSARELRDPAVLDSLAMQRLLAWLGAQSGRLDGRSLPASRSTSPSPPSKTMASSSRWLPDCRATASRPDTVGFEIAEPLCTQRRAQVERFMAGCDKLGCFVVIDDFSFDSAVVPLLRSKALRLVKIDARLTGGALRDKLSQAMVVAVVQAVKVLGMHCAAQQVDSQAALQWLTRGRVRLRPGTLCWRGGSRWGRSSGRLLEAFSQQISRPRSASTLIFPGNFF